MTHPDRTPNAIWVTSDIAPDGTYILTVEYSADLSYPMGPAKARAYAAEVIRAAAIARHDAAILGQLGSGVGLGHAGAVIRDLRAERPALDATALGPLAIDALISATTRRPFLACAAGAQRWQWDPEDAVDHAASVLIGSTMVDLDAAYRRLLIAQCDLDDAAARKAVEGLGKWLRQPGEQES